MDGLSQPQPDRLFLTIAAQTGFARQSSHFFPNLSVTEGVCKCQHVVCVQVAGDHMLFQFRLPMLGFIVGTRAALAFGAGLLAAERIAESRRRPLALALIGLGVATTIPAVNAILRQRVREADFRFAADVSRG